MDNKDKRIKELEEAAMELFNLVHDSDLIQNKIRANELYDVIKPQSKQLVCDVCGSNNVIEAPHIGRNCNRCHPL